jgi:hypothetical protein
MARKAALTVSLGSDSPQITRSYAAENQIGTWNEGVSCGLTFVALSCVTSLNGLLIIKKLDWERVKKLGGKFLQLQLEDLAHRYQGNCLSAK